MAARTNQLNKPWRDHEISPHRTKVWTEPPPPKPHHHTITRVPVVYYLSRNGQLQHPHFMEVPLSSPQGLFLTDVISRLTVLRGKGMPAMYSWSCKRSYKNGYVWHDLSENDFIHPAHGHEYVLKGSELPESTFTDTTEHNPPESPPNLTADRRRRNQSCSSIDFNNLQEYSVYKPKPAGAASDASTQTDTAWPRHRQIPKEIVEEEDNEIEISISPPQADSSPETLGSLVKAEPIERSKKIEMGGTMTAGTGSRSSSSSMLMQLISCGSMSFKDCGAAGHGGLGLISQYKTRRVKLEEKEYFSGSLVETKKERLPALKRSTSCNADR